MRLGAVWVVIDHELRCPNRGGKILLGAIHVQVVIEVSNPVLASLGAFQVGDAIANIGLHLVVETFWDACSESGGVLKSHSGCFARFHEFSE